MATLIDVTKFDNSKNRAKSPHTPYNRSNFNIRKEKDQLWSDAVVKVWDQTDNLLMSVLGDLPHPIFGDCMCQMVDQIETAFHGLIEMLENYEDCVENDVEYEQVT
jgi:hypothetical protein